MELDDIVGGGANRTANGNVGSDTKDRIGKHSEVDSDEATSAVNAKTRKMQKKPSQRQTGEVESQKLGYSKSIISDVYIAGAARTVATNTK